MHWLLLNAFLPGTAQIPASAGFSLFLYCLTLRSHIRTLGQLMKLKKKTFKELNTIPRGPWWVSEFFGGLIYPFCVRIKPCEVSEL
jgi:hypothetical protein